MNNHFHKNNLLGYNSINSKEIRKNTVRYATKATRENPLFDKLEKKN